MIHTIATGNPHLSELEDEMTGSLTTKHGKYYVVVRVPDGTGGMKARWIPTGISSEGNNKRKAQQKRLEILAELEHDKDLVSSDMPFSTWLEQWMEIKRSVVRQNTLECYRYYLDKHIKPYFDAKKLTLKAVTAQSIQDYYSLKLSEGQSANTICKHNVIIAGALREAKRKKFIRENPAEDVTLPSKERFIGKAYSAEDVKRLLSVLDNEEIKPAVVLGLFYGLRRSEVCGLRWQDIDFEAGKMQICNTVVKEKSLIEHEQTKSRASRRTMLLIPETVPYLEKLRIDQIALRSRMGSQWQDNQEHVCVRKDSRPFLPDYVSQGFARLLKKYQLPPLRFHELRHTAGSLLLEHGMSAKQIQEYLGHEQVSTTLDIYTHLSTAGKAETAHTMGSIFRNM